MRVLTPFFKKEKNPGISLILLYTPLMANRAGIKEFKDFLNTIMKVKLTICANMVMVKINSIMFLFLLG